MVKSSQTVGSEVYPFEYSYNLGGQMTQEKYPSGRLINFGYDEAGRLSNLNSGQGHVWVDAFTYAGHGALSGFTLGNGATVSLGYGTNGRLQLSDITLAKNGTTLQKYEYNYGVVESGSVNTAKNTGQLAQVESWIGTEKQYRQQFEYDVLGRTTRSVETYGTSLGSTAYDLKYRYDVFGNREQRSTDNSGNSAIVQKWVENGDLDTANNRYETGVTYDAAGNITADPRFRNLLYGYDANGRQNYTAQANGSSPVVAIFDGAGQRVAEKSAASSNIMVYDAAGKLAAEYAQATPPSTANIQYVTANYQGSTSVITDNGGAVASRHDYLPFGEEIGAGVGSRTTTKMFTQTDTVRQKYAGMETDDATGMAHTLWRKQDNWSGRWTSPDPYGGSMTTADPQSFNRYTYCNNDPVNHADLAGLSLADIGVYQTDDSRAARSAQNSGDIAFREQLEADQARNNPTGSVEWLFDHGYGPQSMGSGSGGSGSGGGEQQQTPPLVTQRQGPALEIAPPPGPPGLSGPPPGGPHVIDNDEPPVMLKHDPDVTPDSLTSSPTAMKLFYCPWVRGGYGTKDTERSTWITMNGGAIGEVRWPGSSSSKSDSWKGALPPGTIAQAHTHPEGGRVSV